MSDFGTVAAENATGTSAKLKHIGTSLLPLALFVASTLGYEQFTQSRQAGPAPSAPALVSAKLAAGPADAPVAGPKAGTSGERTESLVSPPKAATRTIPDIQIALRDERSLLELSRLETARAPIAAAPPSSPLEQPPKTTPEPALAPRQAAVAALPQVPSPPVPPIEPVTSRRVVDAMVDSVEPVALGFKNEGDTGLGAYAIVRGVPATARLSHGIAVAEDSWLIDGVDIPRTTIDLGVRTSGKVVLDLAVLSSTSVLLHRETVTIDVKQQPTAAPALAAAPAPTLAANTEAAPRVEAEPAATITSPKTQAPVASPVTTPAPVSKAAAAPVAPPMPPISVRISRETKLVPGRGGLLKLDIEPVWAIPPGAFVIVHGLPADTVMSRGIGMGPDAWLLTLAELSELEVRLPAKASGTLHLATTLVTIDGRLIAADKVDIALPAPLVPPALPAPAQPGPQPVAVPPPAARLAAAPSQIVTRALAPKPAATAPAPTPPAAALTPAQIALARGRRMLDIGNIAAARPMLERSAREGSGDAAAWLAASFDDAWLRKTGALGISADAAKARYWYDEAQKLGVVDAERVTGLQKAR